MVMSANRGRCLVMNERERAILTAIITHYLEYGESVGSRTLEKKYNIGVSSATIRNVMADLEDQGLIEKMHTSSGRVPTNSGYKLYVEELIKIRKISLNEKKRIEEVYKNKINQIDSIMEETSKLLSKITSYAGIVIEPFIKKESIKKVELVHVNNYMSLAVIVMNNSHVRTINLYYENPVTEAEVRESNSILNRLMTEQKITFTVSELEKLLQKMNKFEHMKIEDKSSNEREKIFFDGISNLLESNATKVEAVIDRAKLLNRPDYLKSIFVKLIETDKYKNGEVYIVFGEDFNVRELEDFSFVFSVYTVEGSKGIIGVIGPKRMEYSKTVGLVNHVSAEVKKMMKKIE